MKHLPWIVLFLVCGAFFYWASTRSHPHQPTPPPPSPSVVMPASPELVLPVPLLEPVPPVPSAAPSFMRLSPVLWDDTLPGRWISIARGDAVQGSKLTDGFRIEFDRGKAPSKTPWHFNFMRPTKKTHTSLEAEGGCGFYLSGSAYCRGYGLDVDGKALATHVDIQAMDPGILEVRLGDVFDEILKKAP